MASRRPVLLIAGILCRRRALARLADRLELRRTMVQIAVGAAALLVIGAVLRFGFLQFGWRVQGSAAVAIVLIGAAMLLKRKDQASMLPLMILALVAILALPSPQTTGHSERSFFGVHRVATTANGEARFLLHGTTLHGVDRLKQPDGQPIEQPIPATYYHAQSPMALGIDIARQRARAGKPFGVGIVGLGTGSLACYARPGEKWRFFEIDPSVVKIARDPQHFRYLPVCQPNADIVLGDARLTLGKEPAAHFDYLVVDAFSSDAVPVHLLTREALALYLDKVGPSGLVALHISNRHLDLPAMASALVASMAGVHATLVIGSGDIRIHNMPSVVLFVSRDKAAISDVAALRGGKPLPAPSIRPWTDDRSDILSVLWRQ